MEPTEIVISVIVFILALLAYGMHRMKKKIEGLEDEVTNMRYIRVKQNEDGSYTLTSQDGKPIFEL